jgi:hypothetical protein
VSLVFPCHETWNKVRVAFLRGLGLSAIVSSVLRELRCNRLHLRSRSANAVPIAFLAIACNCVAYASGQSRQPDNLPRTLHGTVVNGVTHEPVARALVYSSGNRFAMLTDGEGHFDFPLPEGESNLASENRLPRPGPAGAGRGLIWLMARKPGFLQGPNDGGQVQASPGSDNTISLIPEALIKGRVSLPAADGAAGVEVQILFRQVQNGIPRWLPGATVRANSNGEFRFAELRAGTYKLLTHEVMDNDPAGTLPQGQHYGFPPVYYPGAVDFVAAGTIQLLPGQTFQADFSLARQPYYPVSIPFTIGDEKGGIQIAVSVQGHRGPGYSLTYNSDKQRIEGLLPNGSYLVELATFGSNPANGAVNIAVSGATVEGPRVALTRNSTIKVNVKEDFSSTDWNDSGSGRDGNLAFTLHGPRAYLQIRAETADDFEPQRGGSLRPPSGPDDNTLLLDNLAPGRYWLQFHSSRGYVASATVGGVDLLHEPLVVASGSSAPIEITMRDDGAKIGGALASMISAPKTSAAPPDPGAAIPRAFIYCVPIGDGPGEFQQLSVGADGKFTSPMMAPGTYRVMAFQTPQPTLPYRDTEAMRAYETKGQVVQLSPGQKQSVQLQIISSSD